MIDEWLRDHLVCPRDRTPLTQTGDTLTCSSGHDHYVVDDVPVMLVEDDSPTHPYITSSLEKVERIRSGEERVDDVNAISEGVDAFVQNEIPYTCGNLYFSVQGKLERYPIPELRLREGNGRRLLDIGCNWGRWTIAAEQKGYRAVGIDPSLDAVLAARRVSRQLGLSPSFVVGDARCLPFSNDSFDSTFSYSVLQHFRKENARAALSDMSRVTRPGGSVVVQMANRFGLRSMYHQIRRGFKDGVEGSDVFYWSPRELAEVFTSTFGSASISVDCYFGLNIQRADMDMLPFAYRVVIRVSELLRRMSARFSSLAGVADSLYVSSTNRVEKE